ncbi:hypothetical protein [Roseiconus lacunae]|uniref:Uncharacterized protein n=1 Tax=Roseiconus lacunae TaxID=2605694 RepID=A0ABT7PSP2_9BACT|nr:hypothetical protein [Roseiconus lacunae]MDM4019514.1 hypothetical protein [Roseiconus lacunae]
MKLNVVRRFSLRTAMVIVVLFAMVFAVIAVRHRKLHEHRVAIAELQRLGARLNMTNTESQNLDSVKDAVGSWRRTLVAMPDVYVPQVRFNNPNLTEDDVRTMIPHLNNLLPLFGQNFAGESFIVLDINNSPLMTDAFCAELKPLLPGCRFLDAPNRKPGPSPYSTPY